MTGKLMIKEKLISWPEQILSISIRSCRKSMWTPGYTVYICTYTLQQQGPFSVSRHPLISEDCGGLHADLQDLSPSHKLSSCAPFLTGGTHDDTSPIPTLTWMQVPSLHHSVHHSWLVERMTTPAPFQHLHECNFLHYTTACTIPDWWNAWWHQPHSNTYMNATSFTTPQRAPFLTGGTHDDTSPIPTFTWMQLPSLHHSVHHSWLVERMTTPAPFQHLHECKFLHSTTACTIPDLHCCVHNSPVFHSIATL